MRIKRYIAATMQEALDRVRAEMGPEALILQTRTLRTWWRPWRAPRVELVAASDRAGNGAPRPAAPGPGAVPDSRGVAQGLAAPGGPAPAELTRWLRRLEAAEVDGALARELARWAALYRTHQGLSQPEAVLGAALNRVMRFAPVWERADGARPARPTRRVAMLVGPTGVGKTTTLAKLAANFALFGGWEVGIISTDTFRMGAIDQVRSYGELIGVPVQVARDAAELKGAIYQLKKELVLIDTAGHSPMDGGHLQGTSELVGALPPRADVLLVVSATTRPADLQELVAAYGRLSLTAVVVTKLDETRRRGALVNGPHWARRPLLYVTTGQGVPDDIEAAEPQSVARWLLAPTEAERAPTVVPWKEATVR